MQALPIGRVMASGFNFQVYGTKGSLKWNLETMNELQLFLVGDKARGYTTVYAGDRYPYHGNFVPGDANAIGYEDMKVIEDYEFLSSVAAGRQHEPGFAEAIDYRQQASRDSY